LPDCTFSDIRDPLGDIKFPSFPDNHDVGDIATFEAANSGVEMSFKWLLTPATTLPASLLSWLLRMPEITLLASLSRSLALGLSSNPKYSRKSLSRFFISVLLRSVLRSVLRVITFSAAAASLSLAPVPETLN